ncbi:hypothetical protein HMSSN036_13180 [Paenibacillus macerans]|nr:hypothetical protein HMSSN036_13180 [Paenibacillus macerans]
MFTHVLLADEINRATPRTQSSLLECMEERQVTIDGVTHELASPFFVMATQNPIDQQGTFPLPEAQLDRFLMRIAMGYPSHGEGVAILQRFKERQPLAESGRPPRPKRWRRPSGIRGPSASRTICSATSWPLPKRPGSIRR